jgi:predicted RNA binding protein YcfA (HicA-like mRNA interferase family)
MTRTFPDVNSNEMVRVLKKLGFELIRQCGTSHAIYRREKDGLRTTIPIHVKKSLKRKTIKAICKDAKITIDELKEFLG